MNPPAMARGIAAVHLLDLWEDGLARRPAERAILLLHLAAPELGENALVDLTVGQRDRNLLLLRQRWFGSTISAVERCPGCEAQLEITFDVADALLDGGAPLADVHATSVDGYEIVFRLPTSRQVAAASTSRDVTAARAALLAGCLVEVRRDGDSITGSDLPPHVVDHLEHAMETIDPQANIEFSLRCAACSRPWSVCFDIVTYLWDEIAFWARQVMREVHLLATAYGWSEREILAMSPRRRVHYLEMAASG